MPIFRIQWLNKCCWYLVDRTFIQIRRKIYEVRENFNLHSKAKNGLHCTDFHEVVIAEGNYLAIRNPELQPTRWSTSIENTCSNSFSLLNKVFSLSRNSRYNHICSRTFRNELLRRISWKSDKQFGRWYCYSVSVSGFLKLKQCLKGVFFVIVLQEVKIVWFDTFRLFL